MVERSDARGPRAGYLLRVALPYGVFSALWIYVSDHVVQLATADEATITRIQTYKGVAFVLVSTAFIGWLLWRDERRRRAVEQARAESEARRAAAEASDRMKSDFLATMSHELRTPLNSVIGFSGVLLRELPGPLNGEQRKQLEMIRGSARHLLALINDVLDLSKIDSGQLRVAREPVALDELVTRTVESLRPAAEVKQLRLEVEPAPGRCEVLADPRRVEQVLLNLVGNAVKFTERGGVRVRWRADEERVAIEVVDTGPGIRPADRDRLFRPFSQIDGGMTRRHEGTGLGLVISRSLARLMGGDVDVESTPGAGSTFRLRLPRSPERPVAADCGAREERAEHDA